ncbi:MAG: hypothetical protein IJ013_03425, partial [Bacteroidaceae bacterium]|nr:hypothetical protein [Bacteroidaceae bacterium]
MKKYFYIMSAAALALASCSEEQELVNAPVSQENRVLTATFEQDAATRTSIGENNALTWSESDAIAVYYTSDDIITAAEYTLTNGDGTTNGTFEITGEESAPEAIHGAAFPYGYATELAEDGTLEMTLPATINQTTAGELDLPMWGTVTDGKIAFKHLAGVLKVNLTEVPADYTTLTVTASNPISGLFTANTEDAEDADNEPVLASNSTEEGAKTVTVTFTNATATTLYLPLPVGTYESIEVSISGTGKAAKVLKKFSNLIVERTKVYKTTVSDYTSVMTPEELVAALAAGGDVTLGTDIIISSKLAISEDLVLDLNNKKLNLNATDNGMEIAAGANVTIKNGDIVHTSATTDWTAGQYSQFVAAIRNNQGNVTLEGVDITSNVYTINNYGA